MKALLRPHHLLAISEYLFYEFDVELENKVLESDGYGKNAGFRLLNAIKSILNSSNVTLVLEGKDYICENFINTKEKSEHCLKCLEFHKNLLEQDLLRGLFEGTVHRLIETFWLFHYDLEPYKQYSLEEIKEQH